MKILGRIETRLGEIAGSAQEVAEAQQSIVAAQYLSLSQQGSLCKAILSVAEAIKQNNSGAGTAPDSFIA